MLTQCLLGCLVLAASALLTPAVRALALAWGAVDVPDNERKLHDRPIPVWGGLAVLAAVGLGVVPSLSDEAFRSIALPLLIAATLVGLLGLADDHWDLPGRLKLLLQCGCVLPAAISPLAPEQLEFVGQLWQLGWWGSVLAAVCLVACINALNLLDGLDGVTSVVGIIAAASFAVIALVGGQPLVIGFAVSLAAALAGFLIYNRPPASIYLGDCGSTIVGLLLGGLALAACRSTSGVWRPSAVAVVMIIPVLDTSLAIVRRKLSGRRFDAADRGHIHHRFQERGLSNWQVLATMATLGAVSGAAAVWAVSTASDLPALIGAAGIVALLVRGRLFGNHELDLTARATQAAFDALARAKLVAVPARPRSDHSPTNQTFEEAWRQLAATMERFHLQRLELVAGDETYLTEHVWQARPDAPSEADWSLSMQFDDDSRGYCRLRVAGPSQTVLSPFRMLHLLDTLRIHGEAWAAEPRRVPPPGDPSRPLKLQLHVVAPEPRRAAA
jgi:UDP-GlcNAc:undecaprenyl-phosphate/decaprenyl-phosphate GlcNAc-1-phosphate transferase